MAKGRAPGAFAPEPLRNVREVGRFDVLRVWCEELDGDLRAVLHVHGTADKPYCAVSNLPAQFILHFPDLELHSYFRTAVLAREPFRVKSPVRRHDGNLATGVPAVFGGGARRGTP